MDDNLSLLENKVVEAVALIKELRAANQQLTARCGELAAQVKDLEAGRERLAGDLASAQATVRDGDGYEEKRKEIEDRVGGLLQKLAALG